MTATPNRAQAKADYAHRADALTDAFERGSDLARLRAMWDLLTHHGLTATWPVLCDGVLRARRRRPAPALACPTGQAHRRRPEVSDDDRP